MPSFPLPVLLVPGLIATPRYYEAQIAPLWRHGPVMLADHTRDDTMEAIARRILATAPPQFALVGHSMGGYVALEILRQAAGRVARLALLDTTARPDAPEQSERRRAQIGLAESGRFAEVPDLQFPLLVHQARRGDVRLLGMVREMAEQTGADAFIRQQRAIMARVDSRPFLGAIRCPTLVLVGDGDEITPLDRAEEMAHGIAEARLLVVPDCGHLCTIEQPAAVTTALVEWMRS